MVLTTLYHIIMVGSQTDAAHHVVLVLCIDAELLEEGNDKDEQFLVRALQERDEVGNQAFIPHLQLHSCVLTQIQQQI